MAGPLIVLRMLAQVVVERSGPGFGSTHQKEIGLDWRHGTCNRAATVERYIIPASAIVPSTPASALARGACRHSEASQSRRSGRSGAGRVQRPHVTGRCVVISLVFSRTNGRPSLADGDAAKSSFWRKSPHAVAGNEHRKTSLWSGPHLRLIGRRLTECTLHAQGVAGNSSPMPIRKFYLTASIVEAAPLDRCKKAGTIVISALPVCYLWDLLAVACKSAVLRS